MTTFIRTIRVRIPSRVNQIEVWWFWYFICKYLSLRFTRKNILARRQIVVSCRVMSIKPCWRHFRLSRLVYLIVFIIFKILYVFRLLKLVCIISKALRTINLQSLSLSILHLSFPSISWLKNPSLRKILMNWSVHIAPWERSWSLWRNNSITNWQAWRMTAEGITSL